MARARRRDRRGIPAESRRVPRVRPGRGAREVSGIAGVVYRDGRSARTETARAMLATMPYRCVDGAHAHASGPAAFAHGALFTVAEDAAATVPFTLDGFMVTADVRLDNRTELIAALSAGTRIGPDVSDTGLIAFAYREWGERCVERLTGDFAFAVWDQRNRTAFCARDHFGSKPLCYYLSDTVFAFGSEPKAILAHPDVPREVNEEYICYHFYPDMLVGDAAITFHRGVYRLEPAHALMVAPDRSKKTRYWQLDPFKEELLPTDEQYFERFNELFSRAVKDRLRTPYRLGSTLSGGLDSSAIACTARDTMVLDGRSPLETYSALFDNVPSSDEREFIAAITAGEGLRPHSVYPDTRSPLIDIDTALRLHDGPFYGVNYFIHWHIYSAAARDGVRVLLDGEDGDTTVSHGIDRLRELVQADDWAQFAAETDAIVANFDNERSYASRLGVMRSYALPYLASRVNAREWGSVLRGVGALRRRFQYPYLRTLREVGAFRALPFPAARRGIRRIVNRSARSSAETGSRAETSVLRAELSEKYRVYERRRAIFDTYFSPPYPSHPRTIHHATLSSGGLVHGLELFERMAAYWGVEIRHPFCDRRLVEHCLAVPPRLKLQDGYTRHNFREAMRGTLPDTVRLRGGKGDLSDVSNYALRRFERDFISSVVDRASKHAREYVDPDAATRALNRFLEADDPGGLMEIWHIATLARWFDPEFQNISAPVKERQTLEMGSQFQ
ncbi:MAG: lasso peptide isopeptide bond-forming cyclase [Spirochaetaceae bacterium]|nr:MAG: lasso peptide isopeptide bond-forming cyclase [Spirochaetaceae bacterium]